MLLEITYSHDWTPQEMEAQRGEELSPRSQSKSMAELGSQWIQDSRCLGHPARFHHLPCLRVGGKGNYKSLRALGSVLASLFLEAPTGAPQKVYMITGSKQRSQRPQDLNCISLASLTLNQYPVDTGNKKTIFALLLPAIVWYFLRSSMSGRPSSGLLALSQE